MNRRRTHFPYEWFERTFQFGEHAGPIAEYVEEGQIRGLVGVAAVHERQWSGMMRRLVELDRRFERFAGGRPDGMSCDEAMKAVEGIASARRYYLQLMSGMPRSIEVVYTLGYEASAETYRVPWSIADVTQFVHGTLRVGTRRGPTHADLIRDYVFHNADDANVNVYYGNRRNGAELVEVVPVDLVAFYLYHAAVLPNMAARSRVDIQVHSAVARDCEAAFWDRDMDEVMATRFTEEVRTRGGHHKYRFNIVSSRGFD